MKKPIILPLPICNKCKNKLEPLFTTEKEEGDNSKPKVLMMFGKCDKCELITMCSIVEIKDLPSRKDFEKEQGR